MKKQDGGLKEIDYMYDLQLSKIDIEIKRRKFAHLDWQINDE
jgi:hypothetical protein